MPDKTKAVQSERTPAYEEFLKRCHKLGPARELDSRAYILSEDLEAGVFVQFGGLVAAPTPEDADKHEALFTMPDGPEPGRIWKIGAVQIVEMARSGILRPGVIYGIRKAEVVKSSRDTKRTVGRYQVVQIGAVE